jgi:Domain of unknown function (DUF2019)
MKKTNLQNATVDQLVELFVEIALEQDHASRWHDIAKYNRLYGKMDDVKRELNRRDGDQRRALVALLDHPNAQVRLKAAISTLAIAPEAARRALQLISDRNEYPQAADARGMMRAVDEGSYVPT